MLSIKVSYHDVRKCLATSRIFAVFHSSCTSSSFLTRLFRGQPTGHFVSRRKIEGTGRQASLFLPGRGRSQQASPISPFGCALASSLPSSASLHLQTEEKKAYNASLSQVFLLLLPFCTSLIKHALYFQSKFTRFVIVSSRSANWVKHDLYAVFYTTMGFTEIYSSALNIRRQRFHWIR